jgi:hypothetical protein
VEYGAGLFLIGDCWSLPDILARNRDAALRLSYGFSAQIGAINQGGAALPNHREAEVEWMAWNIPAA